MSSTRRCRSSRPVQLAARRGANAAALALALSARASNVPPSRSALCCTRSVSWSTRKGSVPNAGTTIAHGAQRASSVWLAPCQAKRTGPQAGGDALAVEPGREPGRGRHTQQARHAQLEAGRSELQRGRPLAGLGRQQQPGDQHQADRCGGGDGKGAEQQPACDAAKPAPVEPLRSRRSQQNPLDRRRDGHGAPRPF